MTDEDSNGSPLVFPPMYLLSTRLRTEEQTRLRQTVTSFTENINEADIIVGNIMKRKRAEFELRRHKLRFHDATQMGPSFSTVRKVELGVLFDGADSAHRGKESASDLDTERIKVVTLSWLTGCLEQRKMLPMEHYLILEVMKTRTPVCHKEILPITRKAGACNAGAADQATEGHVIALGSQQHLPTLQFPGANTKPHSLSRQTTSEHDTSLNLPQIPETLHKAYSCQRATLRSPPNKVFIWELKRIRTLRLLQGNYTGVRAYSTSIAVLSAYPFKLRCAAEVERLPGCSIKIADLFRQWHEKATLLEISAAASDSRLSALQLFHGIWGVGDATAREFYNKGWRDIDDVIEHGWHSLSRVQQLGLKFYSDFTEKISRLEAESIADTVHCQALKIGPGFKTTIVGSYRRGEAQSGDVDIVISHQDETKTSFLIENLVASLEDAGVITHTLNLSTRNSERGQRPLAWHSHDGSSGFDTLDKAMVVWQDKKRGGQTARHRRVDIIVSPWKTVGCALLGWSGDTTFQRDLRRYCKEKLGFKFDSSGIRRRRDGAWLDFEAGVSSSPLGQTCDQQIAPDMEEAEKRVFSGLGLAWRHPTERGTG